MESKAKALGHPIHQMLIPFPFGLLSTAVIFDIIYMFVGEPSTRGTLSLVAFWMTAAGIVGGLLAAPFGLIDYLAIPKGTRARTVGMLHGVGNVFVLAGATGWLGGELVDRLGVGVDDGANLDAPNSLTTSSAHGAHG